jgi:hypothetical protein
VGDLRIAHLDSQLLPNAVILSDDPERREGEESKDLRLLLAMIL